MIFIFHRVLSRADPLRPDLPDVRSFEDQVLFISRNFHVLALGEAVQRLRKGSLPAASACITFDDGYADNLHVAAPILQRHGVCATFFIATGFLDGGRMWNDTVIEAIRLAGKPALNLKRMGLPNSTELVLETPEEKRAAIERILPVLKHLSPEARLKAADRLAHWCGGELPRSLMLTSAELERLSSMGMEIGAHTVNHPILLLLDEAQARREIGQSREELSERLRIPVGLFAYPNGRPAQDYGERDVRLVRELGFDAAVSTARGVSTAETDPFELRRFTPWDRRPHAFGSRLALNYFFHRGFPL